MKTRQVRSLALSPSPCMELGMVRVTILCMGAGHDTHMQEDVGLAYGELWMEGHIEQAVVHTVMHLATADKSVQIRSTSMIQFRRGIRRDLGTTCLGGDIQQFGVVLPYQAFSRTVSGALPIRPKDCICIQSVFQMALISYRASAADIWVDEDLPVLVHHHDLQSSSRVQSQPN